MGRREWLKRLAVVPPAAAVVLVHVDEEDMKGACSVPIGVAGKFLKSGDIVSFGNDRQLWRITGPISDHHWRGPAADILGR